jgi:hypothetical protein
METTVTNLPGHHGAFAQTMQGGAVHYTPDITAAEPHWVEVFDDGAANKAIFTGNDSNGGWIQTSPDDKYLYRAISGRAKGALGPNDPGTTGGVYVLDIQKLLSAGTNFQCRIGTLAEAQNGGAESDCPTVAGTDPNVRARHWAACSLGAVRC